MGPQLCFGANISTSADPSAADSDPVAAARAAEDLGFDLISCTDHPGGAHPTNETWTMLTWIAAATSRITVMPRVLGVPFRNPVLTAKMAETLHRLSGGRLVLGLGAGGSDAEITAMGLPALAARDKVVALEEAVTIIGGVWSQPRFTWPGHHHRTQSAQLEPKPARPIPIWLGTFGPQALAVTGRLADGWIPSLGYAPADQLPTMRQRVLASAEAAGRDPGAIQCILNVAVRVGEPSPGANDATVVGSPVQVVDQLLELVGIGFDGLNFVAVGPDQPDQYRWLAGEIIPALRAQGAGRRAQDSGLTR